MSIFVGISIRLVCRQQNAFVVTVSELPRNQPSQKKINNGSHIHIHIHIHIHMHTIVLRLRGDGSPEPTTSSISYKVRDTSTVRTEDVTHVIRDESNYR